MLSPTMKVWGCGGAKGEHASRAIETKRMGTPENPRENTITCAEGDPPRETRTWVATHTQTRNCLDSGEMPKPRTACMKGRRKQETGEGGWEKAKRSKVDTDVRGGERWRTSEASDRVAGKQHVTDNEAPLARIRHILSYAKPASCLGQRSWQYEAHVIAFRHKLGRKQHSDIGPYL